MPKMFRSTYIADKFNKAYALHVTTTENIRRQQSLAAMWVYATPFLLLSLPSSIWCFSKNPQPVQHNIADFVLLCRPPLIYMYPPNGRPSIEVYYNIEGFCLSLPLLFYKSLFDASFLRCRTAHWVIGPSHRFVLLLDFLALINYSHTVGTRCELRVPASLVSLFPTGQLPILRSDVAVVVYTCPRFF